MHEKKCLRTIRYSTSWPSIRHRSEFDPVEFMQFHLQQCSLFIFTITAAFASASLMSAPKQLKRRKLDFCPSETLAKIDGNVVEQNAVPCNFLIYARSESVASNGSPNRNFETKKQ